MNTITEQDPQETYTVAFTPEELEEGQETGPSFDADLARAREIFTEFGPFTGEHPLTAKAFVEADTHETRLGILLESPGRLRRGFREMAQRMEKVGRQDEAEVFWALRDDIEPAGFFYCLAG